MLSTDVVILSATRTPLGSFQGALSSASAPQLGGTAIRGAVAAAGIEPGSVSSVHLGQVLSAGAGQAPARQAALQAGLPSTVPCTTLNKVCGSGLEAIVQARRALLLGEATFAVAGGMEAMSSAPYLLPKARDGYRIGHQQVIDSLIRDGLWDPYNDLHMGACAEACATRYGFTRARQDEYAIASFQRANAAQQAGLFASEITAVEVTDARGKTTRVDRDEGPERVNYDKLPTLRPAFKPDGTITAANASTLNDGAAALVLTTSTLAATRRLKPLARIVSTGVHAQDPLWFTTAPVQAARHALATAGWAAKDVDLWEINEAFAVVPLAFMQELALDPARVNVRGGAIALGHPLGASGARIVVTLLAALRERGLRRGLAALCIGGGEGLAICVERI
ncbi:MAG TPA: thiolase family protein [Opitutaceae bacterium]